MTCIKYFIFFLVCLPLIGMDPQKYKTVNEKNFNRILTQYGIIKEHRRRSTDTQSRNAAAPEKLRASKKPQVQVVEPLVNPTDDIQHIVAMCTAINDFRNQGGTILISIINAPAEKVAADDRLELITFALDRCLNLQPDAEADAENYRAIHYACKHGYLKIIELLLNRGADKNALTKENETPYQILINSAHDFQEQSELYLSILKRLK